MTADPIETKVVRKAAISTPTERGDLGQDAEVEPAIVEIDEAIVVLDYDQAEIRGRVRI